MEQGRRRRTRHPRRDGRTQTRLQYRFDHRPHSRKKGFVAHKAYGKTHEYYPVVSKDDYARRYMDTVLNNFFGGSVSRLVSFFSEHKAISLEETDAILDMLKSRK